MSPLCILGSQASIWQSQHKLPRITILASFSSDHQLPSGRTLPGIAHSAQRIKKISFGRLQTPNVRSYCTVAANTSSIFRLVAQPVADCWLLRLSVQIGCETPP
jgi:hypothetical protein